MGVGIGFGFRISLPTPATRHKSPVTGYRYLETRYLAPDPGTCSPAQPFVNPLISYVSYKCLIAGGFLREGNQGKSFAQEVNF